MSRPQTQIQIRSLNPSVVLCFTLLGKKVAHVTLDAQVGSVESNPHTDEGPEYVLATCWMNNIFSEGHPGHLQNLLSYRGTRGKSKNVFFLFSVSSLCMGRVGRSFLISIAGTGRKWDLDQVDCWLFFFPLDFSAKKAQNVSRKVTCEKLVRFTSLQLSSVEPTDVALPLLRLVLTKNPTKTNNSNNKKLFWARFEGTY